MNEAAPPAHDSATSVILPVAAPSLEASSAARQLRAAWWLATVIGVLALVSLGLAWKADGRVRNVEQELVRRQQDSATQSSEARLLGKQAQEVARDAAAKVALLEARVAEVSLQRSQLEDLMQSLSRSRDENLLVDVEAALRAATQQAAVTGSAEPLVATLKQLDERLARYSQPRLEGVRRAVARDLDRVKAASIADVATLTIKLDEATRLIDELPALSGPAARRGEPAQEETAAIAGPGSSVSPTVAGGAVPASAASSGSAAGTASSASTASSARLASRPSASAPSAPALPSAGGGSWTAATRVQEAVVGFVRQAWADVRSLVRVTRVEHADAVLMAPEHAFFLRENLKLRLLNARLALLSRQFDIVQGDLQAAQSAIDRYFDRNARRTALVLDLLRQVAAQARLGGVPRPDDTLAALAAAAPGR